MPRSTAQDTKEFCELEFIHLAGLPKSIWLPKLVLLNNSKTLKSKFLNLGFKGDEIQLVKSSSVNEHKSDKFLDYHLFNCPIQAIIHWTRNVANKGAVSYFQDLDEQTYYKDSVLICSEEVLTLDGRILPPANNMEQAEEIMKDIHSLHPDGTVLQLHSCLQFVSLNDSNLKQVNCHATVETTQIILADFTKQDIEGACGIFKYNGERDSLIALLTDSVGMSLVKGIEGCYHNLTGIPLNRVSYALTALSLYRISQDPSVLSIESPKGHTVWDDHYSFILPSCEGDIVFVNPLEQIDSVNLYSQSSKDETSSIEDDYFGVVNSFYSEKKKVVN